MTKIRIIIIHHSATIRIKLKRIFSMEPEFEVLISTYEMRIASNKMQKNWPHVIVLGVDQDRSDTYSFIQQVNEYKSTAFVIITNTKEGVIEKKLKGMGVKACEVIVRPRFDSDTFFREYRKLIVDAVKNAYNYSEYEQGTVAVHTPFNFKRHNQSHMVVTPKLSPDLILPSWDGKIKKIVTDKIIGIGASAGGIKAIEFLLTKLPVKTPGIVIVQHLPGKFTNDFAKRIDSMVQMEVREAKDGDRIHEGLVLIAPGGRHMLVKRTGNNYKIAIKDGPPITRHCPSVDVLFRSLAISSGGNNILGIILTGMGDDGAREMVAFKNSGAFTIAQDEKTSAVFGMPSEAIKRGGVSKILPLDKIADAIQQFYEEKLK